MRKEVFLAGLGLCLLNGNVLAQTNNLPHVRTQLTITSAQGNLDSLQVYNGKTEVGSIVCFSDKAEFFLDTALAGGIKVGGDNNWNNSETGLPQDQFEIAPGKCQQIVQDIGSYVNDLHQKVLITLDPNSSSVVSIDKGSSTATGVR